MSLDVARVPSAQFNNGSKLFGRGSVEWCPDGHFQLDLSGHPHLIWLFVHGILYMCMQMWIVHPKSENPLRNFLSTYVMLKGWEVVPVLDFWIKDV